jgi:hypothetical protein
MTFEYYIEDGIWRFYSSEFNGEILGVLISLDSKDYYKTLNEQLGTRDFYSSMPNNIITLLKHGIPEIVKSHYLVYVDSPLREFCSFHYIELKPTNLNCNNINKIISTSCLPEKYLHNLIKDNECQNIS